MTPSLVDKMMSLSGMGTRHHGSTLFQLIEAVDNSPRNTVVFPSNIGIFSSTGYMSKITVMNRSFPQMPCPSSRPSGFALKKIL